MAASNSTAIVPTTWRKESLRSAAHRCTGFGRFAGGNLFAGGNARSIGTNGGSIASTGITASSPLEGPHRFPLQGATVHAHTPRTAGPQNDGVWRSLRKRPRSCSKVSHRTAARSPIPVPGDAGAHRRRTHDRTAPAVLSASRDDHCRGWAPDPGKDRTVRIEVPGNTTGNVVRNVVARGYTGEGMNSEIQQLEDEDGECEAILRFFLAGGDRLVLELGRQVVEGDPPTSGSAAKRSYLARMLKRSQPMTARCSDCLWKRRLAGVRWTTRCSC